jgi:hypothetical protein
LLRGDATEDAIGCEEGVVPLCGTGIEDEFGGGDVLLKETEGGEDETEGRCCVEGS